MNVEQFDNELFNLSQQADQANAMPINEAAWQRMEQLLDGDKKKRRLVLWWWLLPLLLIGIGVFFYRDSSSISRNKIIANTKENQQEITTKKIENNNSIQEHKSILNIKIEEDKTNKNTGAFLTGKNTNKQQEQAAKQAIVTVKTTNNYQLVKVKQQNIANVELMINQSVVVKNNGDSKSVDNNPIIGKQNIIAANNKITVVANNSDSLKQEIVVLDKVADAKETENQKTIVTDTMRNPLVTSTAKKTKPPFLSKFDVSVFMSADATTANFNNTDKKSLAYGFGLSYQLSKKLSIATGFGISRKLYSADSADYKSQYNSGTAYQLISVDANCLVYEVPLNMQYQFSQNKRSSWLAIGGISTYFMKSEAYDYNYLWYGQPRKTNYLIKDKNNQLFSILNLAIGYRRQLGKQLSYQLAPFIKIPLTGIGEGKVNLYSAGLQLSVNLKGK